jgi:hypothetical protein
MASLMSKVTRFARSRQGQEMTHKAMRFARSPEGKRKIAQARARVAGKRTR